MKIKFIGATGGDVTGSCILCCARNGTRFLVDCGLYQGGGFFETKNARFPFDPRTIDFVLLTHAHLDHCGRIPMLYDLGFEGKVICSKATRDLAILNIIDGKKRDEEEWEHVRKRGEDAVRNWEKAIREQWEPHFWTEAEIPKIKEDRNAIVVDNDLHITMLRSSHFLGASSFMVGWDYRKDNSGKVISSKNICFSGDLGGVTDETNDHKNHLTLLKDGMVPFPNTDYIVMESTYGATEREPEHKDFSRRIEHLKSLLLKDGIDDFVFPCFAMQRTQDILFDLVYLAMREEECKLNITLDSPMGKNACAIYREALKEKKPAGGKKDMYLNKDFVRRFSPLLEKSGYAQSKGITEFISDVLSGKFSCSKSNVGVFFDSKDKTPEGRKNVCITSSGMLQEGPVLKHISEKYNKSTAAFVITGYCRSTPNGRTLSAWEGDGKDGVVIYQDGKDEKEISREEWKADICSVASYYSGHADVEGLLRFLFRSSKEDEKTPYDKDVTTFLVHGDMPCREALKETIEREGEKPENQKMRRVGRVELPNATSPFYDLDAGKWCSEDIQQQAFAVNFPSPSKEEAEANPSE